jgi:ornithine cyclodeaminase
MTDPVFLTYDTIRPHVRWPDAVAAIADGHRRPRAEIKDLFLGPEAGKMMSRCAYIPGLGYGAKTFTVFAGNAALGRPSVQGAMTVFDAETGGVRAIVESQLVTEVKTAADSVLGATLLARPNSEHLLIVGAGVVAQSLIRAYAACLPSLKTFSIWARRPDQAQPLALGAQIPNVTVRAVENLAEAAATADIISSATMAKDPILQGDWIQPGTHVDLIGAFKSDMREADDALITKSRLFVDSRDTTIGHIGELVIPIAQGTITESDVLGDFYDLVTGTSARRNDDDITLFKNGGGAHMDLMTAHYLMTLA